MNKYKKEEIAILIIFIFVVLASLLYTHLYNRSNTPVCSPIIKLTVVSGIWCQSGGTFSTPIYDAGLIELLLSNKVYSSFNISLNIFVKSGDSLVVGWDFNSSTGDFYDLRISKLYNTVLFEKYINWERVFYTSIDNFSSLSKVNIIKHSDITSIYLNNSLIYTINDNKSGNLVLLSEFASGNFSNINLNGKEINPININTYIDLLFAILFGLIFVILLIFREKEEIRRRGIIWDILIVVIILLPIISFLYEGTVTGYYLILYVPFLYVVYIILEYINKGKILKITDIFSFRDEYRKFVYVIIIIAVPNSLLLPKKKNIAANNHINGSTL